MALAAHDKRQFIHTAFHPYGREFCDRIGMLPEHSDVADAEMVDVINRLTALMESPNFAALQQMASWQVEAMHVVHEDDVLLGAPEEMYIRFFAAVCVALFGGEVPA